MFRSSIPKEDIQHLPLIRFDGEIHVIDSEEELSNALHILNKQDVLGFDTETKPTFNKGERNSTALIQFATLTDAYLIRVKKTGIPNELKKLMENPKILKVGISLRDDLKELKLLRPFRAKSFIDLNDIAKEIGVTQIGMKSLSGIFLDSRVSKSQQTSNWELADLSNGQKMYAATDAWVCIKIYNKLQKKGYL